TTEGGTQPFSVHSRRLDGCGDVLGGFGSAGKRSAALVSGARASKKERPLSGKGGGLFHFVTRSRPMSYKPATTSISTKASLGSRATCTVERAGGAAVK